MRTVKLHNDVEIPLLGFGTWQLTGEEGRNAVQEAIATGYRHLDTALAYDNHKEVAAGIEASGVARKDLFVTSKIWRDDLSADGVKRQMDQILDELNTDYVDLTLIHWPNSDFDMSETLSSLENQRLSGKTRAIGVSNFTISHLEEALNTGINISMNQVEYHPSLNQEKLRQFCVDTGIAVTGYSPLAQGDDLKLETLQELAEKYDVSSGQVILNWLLSKNIVAIPRSGKPEHICDNFKATTWELEQEDITAIDNIGGDHRLINPPFAEF